MPTDDEGQIALGKLSEIDPHLEELVSITIQDRMFTSTAPADVFWIRSRFEVPKPNISHISDDFQNTHKL